MLRQLSFIKDAKILVINNSQYSDSVDILILTKDIWSIGIEISPKSNDKFNLNLYNENLLGHGCKLQNKISLETNDKKFINYNQGYYKIKNINGSFIDSKIHYFNQDSKENLGIEFNKDFITPETKYAGGFEIVHHNNYERLNENNLFSQKNRVLYDELNVWIGKSIPIKNFLKRSRYVLSCGVYNKYFSKSPDTDDDSYNKYNSYSRILSGFSIVSNNYYKSNFIYNYGITEDIPYGQIFNVTLGVDLQKNAYRIYSGLKISKAQYKKFGYFHSCLKIGGFIKKNKYEDGIIDANFKYFTPLLIYKNLKLRNFVKINYCIGLERFSDDLLEMKNEQGIRGLYSDELKGLQRLNFGIETINFTETKILGFNYSLFYFADFGFIGSNKKNIFKNTLYSGIGIGFRIRNESLIFKTFQIRLAYYPNAPDANANYNFLISGKQTLDFDDFNVQKPDSFSLE